MNSSNERESFSQRLQQALKNAHYSPDSPTRLAREFNIRFDGRPITVHAARKWLVGEAIPLGARIIAVVDAYHAMTTDRPYQQAHDTAWALAELRRCAGTQFDPGVVQAFERVLKAEEVLSHFAEVA